MKASVAARYAAFSVAGLLVAWYSSAVQNAPVTNAAATAAVLGTFVTIRRWRSAK